MASNEDYLDRLLKAVENGEELPAELPEEEQNKEIEEPPELSDVPAMTELPDGAEISDLPDAPEAADLSDSSEIPDTPDTPDMPEISEIPGISDLPELSGAPDISELSENAGEPDMADISDILDMAEVLEEPGLSEFSDIPDMPEAAEEPDLSEFSDIPDMKGAMEEPDLSALPELSDMPETEGPELSELPDIPDMPAAAEEPDMSEMTDMPEAEEMPETTEIPDISEIPEAAEETDIPEMEDIPDMPEMTDLPGEQPEEMEAAPLPVDTSGLDPEIASLVEQIPELAETSEETLEDKLDKIVIQQVPEEEPHNVEPDSDEFTDEDIQELLAVAGEVNEDLAEINELLKKNDNHEPVAVDEEPEELPPGLAEEPVPEDEEARQESGKKKKKVRRRRKKKGGEEAAEETEGVQEGEGDEPAKKGFFARILDALTDTEEEETAPEEAEAEDKQMATGENLDILNEMDEEGDGKKKGKKGKKGKKEKEPKEKKPKKEKKSKKEKVPGDETEKEPKKRLPKKGLISIILCSVSIFVFVLLAAIFVPRYMTVGEAYEDYAKKDYKEVYRNLSGMNLRGEDAKLYRKVKLIMILENQYDDFTYYQAQGMRLEALDALVYGIRLADRYAPEADELGIREDFNEVFYKLTDALEQEFSGTQELAREWNQLEKPKDYTRELSRFLYGDEYLASLTSGSQKTEQPEPAAENTVLKGLEGGAGDAESTDSGVFGEASTETDKETDAAPKQTENEPETAAGEPEASETPAAGGDGAPAAEEAPVEGSGQPETPAQTAPASDPEESGVYGNDNSGLVQQDMDELMRNTQIDIQGR